MLMPINIYTDIYIHTYIYMDMAVYIFYSLGLNMLLAPSHQCIHGSLLQVCICGYRVSGMFIHSGANH